MGWGVLLLRGFAGGPGDPAARSSAGLLLWPVAEGPGALALALVPALQALGLDPWGRPRPGGGGAVGRLPGALVAAHRLRPVPPLEQAQAWAQARHGTLLALRRRAGPDLWLACWRRHPWEAQWHWRCRPQPLPAFQQRFLPGAGARDPWAGAWGPEGLAGSR